VVEKDIVINSITLRFQVTVDKARMFKIGYEM